MEWITVERLSKGLLQEPTNAQVLLIEW